MAAAIIISCRTAEIAIARQAHRAHGNARVAATSCYVTASFPAIGAKRSGAHFIFGQRCNSMLASTVCSGSDLDETAGAASWDSLCKNGECSMAERNQSSSSGSSHRGGSGNFAEDRERASEAGRKGGEASGGNFANDPERASEAGRKGGEASGGNFANDPERASEAGRKGGEVSGGNFANDPERASEAGRKGGEASGGNFADDPERAAEAGRKGGEASGGNFADDPERAAEAGRKGGQSRSG